MKEITIILRRERVDALVHALRGAGVSRMAVSRIHAIGSGVDPEQYRVSGLEGIYMEKVKVELVCPADEVEDLIAIARRLGRTGYRGDGELYVTDVERIVNLRTGSEGALALA
jgi:nitrogen regulatory protein PII